MTDDCARDLEVLAGLVLGFRLPKVETESDILWVAERAPNVTLDCTIESARGVVAVHEIVRSEACFSISYGGLDLSADLGIAGGDLETLFARSSLVVAARAAGKPPPSDGVHALIYDDAGLRSEAEAARRLGFSASPPFIRDRWRSSMRYSRRAQKNSRGQIGSPLRWLHLVALQRRYPTGNSLICRWLSELAGCRQKQRHIFQATQSEFCHRRASYTCMRGLYAKAGFARNCA